MTHGRHKPFLYDKRCARDTYDVHQTIDKRSESRLGDGAKKEFLEKMAADKVRPTDDGVEGIPGLDHSKGRGMRKNLSSGICSSSDCTPALGVDGEKRSDRATETRGEL